MSTVNKLQAWAQYALTCLLVLVVLLPTARVLAQEGTPGATPAATPAAGGPVYIVQEGDSLWGIAVRFNIGLTELQNANSLVDPNTLAAGMQLVIPGLEGISGVLTTEKVGYGETLESLSLRYAVPVETLVRLNHLTSPLELYAGANLIIPQKENSVPAGGRSLLAPGQSLLELAVQTGANPWALVQANHLPGAWAALPGAVLNLPGTPGAAEAAGPGALPPAIHSIELNPLPVVQGYAALIKISAEPGMQLNGRLSNRTLNFFSLSGDEYIALQGLHALLEPGLHPLVLTGTLSSGAVFSFSQAVFVLGGDYPYDPVLTVNPETIDPAVTQPEDAEWIALAVPVTPEKQWEGAFIVPAPEIYADCWPSTFGNRRSYNGSAYDYFHTGLDYCGGVGTEIYAPAAGTVVFAGPLTVRGNATMIDHGWGVYSGYMHQSEILVQPGDRVEAGQIIGKVGNTGRVTGAHLHFEIWVGGVQVDPLDWLSRILP